MSSNSVGSSGSIQFVFSIWYAIMMSNSTNNQTTLPCSNNFPSTEHLYKELLNDVAILVLTALAALFTLLTICLYIEEVLFLNHNCKNKTKRTKICCILALYPVVSFTSMLILLVPRSTLIGEFVASVFLGFCIVQFVGLIFEYFGGEEEMLMDFEGEEILLRTGPCCCCCCCLPKIPLNKRTLKFIKIMVLQVAVVRPVILFIATVLWTDGHYTPGSEVDPKRSEMYINFINVASVLFAMYGMILTYTATTKRLKNYRFGLKFGSLQLGIVIIQLQTSVLATFGKYGLPYCSPIGSSVVRSSRTNHFLLTLEMLLVAIMARFAYRRLETEEDLVKSKNSNEQDEIINTDSNNHTHEKQLSSSIDMKEVYIQRSSYNN